MKIGILTSSRADLGIYHSLIEKLIAEKSISLQLIAFGMHQIPSQGKTIKSVRAYDCPVSTIEGMTSNSELLDITSSYGKLIQNFAKFWSRNTFDLLFVLGDRWEMSAAVQSTIPYEIKLAHIHGGETTLGALDNIYRHQITLASDIHFTSNKKFSRKVSNLIGHNKGIYTVGSLSIENIETLELPEWKEVKTNFKIPFETFILLTLHPETVGTGKNSEHLKIVESVLNFMLSTGYNFLITKANSDAKGNLYNDFYTKLEEKFPNQVRLVSALGKLNYFKTIQKCKYLIGNTSSGIIEAASFRKWVINIGDRQKGRLQSGNVLDTELNYNSILNAIEKLKSQGDFLGENKYSKKNTSDRIVKIIKRIK